MKRKEITIQWVPSIPRKVRLRLSTYSDATLEISLLSQFAWMHSMMQENVYSVLTDKWEFASQNWTCLKSASMIPKDLLSSNIWQPQDKESLKTTSPQSSGRITSTETIVAINSQENAHLLSFSWSVRLINLIHI